MSDGTWLSHDAVARLSEGTADMCLSQLYFQCSDIKIVPGENFDPAKYHKTPVQWEPTRNLTMFQCSAANVYFYTKYKNPPEAKQADDIGLHCLANDLHALCLDRRLNMPNCIDCLDPKKTFPVGCRCKWYKRNAVKLGPKL